MQGHDAGHGRARQRIALARRQAVGTIAMAIAFAFTTGAARAAGPDIASAVMVEIGYRMDVVSQSMNFDYESWTLFDDGTAYRNLPPTAPADFDVAASRTRQPASWGRWRKQGGKLEVRWSDASGRLPEAWTAPKKWFALTVPRAGQTLDAVYALMGAQAQKDLFASSFATGWKVLTFHADGRFEQGTGGSAGVAQGAGGGEVLSAQTGKASGRYRIDGSTLELKFDDGRVQRASMYFSSEDRKTLLLNGARLVLRGKP